MEFDTLVGIVIGVAATFIVEGWLVRSWDRTMRMAELLEELVAVHGQYLVRISLMSTPGPSGQDFINLQARTFTTLSLMRMLARWPLRRWRKVRSEVERLLAKTSAAQLQSQRGKQLTLKDITEGFPIDPLRQALHGKVETLDSEVRFYMEHGFLDGDPDRWTE